MITFKAKATDGEYIRSVFQPFTFPAGEVHTKIETRRTPEKTEIAVIQPTADSIHDDLFQLAMWNNSVMRTVPTAKRVLIIPYFPGARADRGIPLGAGVYTDFIEGLRLSQVILYDPHSEVVVNLLNNPDSMTKITPVYPHEILGTTVSQLVMPDVYDAVLAPDKGARDRAGAVARQFSVPLYTATKTRDFETGALTGFGLEEPFPDHVHDVLIVDDICDGGGTFMGLAKAIRETRSDIRLDLYVSHGVFSKNALDALPDYFDEVFTTNSYAPHRSLNGHSNNDGIFHDVFRVIDVIRPLLNRIDV